MTNAQYFENLAKGTDTRALYAQLWLDDATINDLFKKTQSKDESISKPAKEVLDNIMLMACEVYAGPLCRSSQNSIHGATDLGDIMNEMYIKYLSKLPEIASQEEPKRYAIVCLIHAGKNYVSNESNLFNVYNKANSKNREDIKKALKGETVKTGDSTRDYVYNTIVAQSSASKSLDEPIKDDSGKAGQQGNLGCSFGETVVDWDSVSPFEKAELKASFTQALYRLPDPMMRIAVAAFIIPENDNEAYVAKQRRTNAARYCHEHYGMDKDLFDTSLERGMACLKYFWAHVED